MSLTTQWQTHIEHRVVRLVEATENRVGHIEFPAQLFAENMGEPQNKSLIQREFAYKMPPTAWRVSC